MVKASEIPDILATMPGFEKIEKDDTGSWVHFKGKILRCCLGDVKGFVDFQGDSVSYFTNENTRRDYLHHLKISIL